MQYCDELEASIKESQQQNEMLLQQVLRKLWVSLAIAPIRDEKGEISNYVCAMQDISFIKESQHALGTDVPSVHLQQPG
mgnify:CR=1 FL=1